MSAHYDDEDLQENVVEAMADFAKRLSDAQRERVALVNPALEALRRLVAVCGAGTGQSCRVAMLLWSLYNGRPVSLLDLVGLDWVIRKDLGTVMLAWGFESRAGSFFYTEMKAAFRDAGLWVWLLELVDSLGGAEV